MGFKKRQNKAIREAQRTIDVEKMKSFMQDLKDLEKKHKLIIEPRVHHHITLVPRPMTDEEKEQYEPKFITKK